MKKYAVSRINLNYIHMYKTFGNPVMCLAIDDLK